MAPLIQAHNLGKSFGQTCAVDALTLQVKAGEIYGLVGSDGAGKTTTLRLLCGALQPTTGEAIIAGFSMTRQSERGREQIGYLPQRFSLYEELTVLENLRFFAEVRGLPSAEWQPRSRDILTFVGLGSFGERRAGRLSGGMKQKLGLAVALVHRPRILLLDEPTTGVDPVTRQNFWQLIIRLAAEEDVAVLVSTPYMDEAARSTRLGFMRGGRLWLEGTPDELRGRLQGRVLELRGRPLPLLRQVARIDPDVERALTFGDRLHLHIRPGCAEQIQIRLPAQVSARGGQFDWLGPIFPHLEDVFLSLVQSEPEEMSP